MQLSAFTSFVRICQHFFLLSEYTGIFILCIFAVGFESVKMRSLGLEREPFLHTDKIFFPGIGIEQRQFIGFPKKGFRENLKFPSISEKKFMDFVSASLSSCVPNRVGQTHSKRSLGRKQTLSSVFYQARIFFLK